jgi:DNA primase
MAFSNLQLTPQFVQAVRDAADVYEVAASATKLQRAGRKWKGLCPLHKEKTPSFHVDPEVGFFKCFGCGAGGDAIKLHMLLTGDDFAAAMEALAGRFGVPLPAPRAAPRGREGREGGAAEPEQVLGAALDWYRAQLASSEEARRYLERRQVPAELVERFELGYAPDGWRHLAQALGGRVAVGDLIAVGLVVRPDGGGEPYDRFRHRLIFPIRNPTGRLVGFGGRTLGDDVAKYLNTAETERFHKSELLYGLDRAKRAVRESRRVLVVEGYLDVIGAVAAGIEGAVATMGTALTGDQARLLARFADEVVLGYDGDAAGETACRRALPILAAHGLAVRRARLPEGEDPDSVRVGAGAPALRALVDQAEDLVVLEMERLVPADVHRNPQARARAGKALVELLAPIQDPILRYGYVRLAADRLGVPPELLVRRVGLGKEAIAGALAPPASAGRQSTAGGGAEGPPTPGRRAEQEALRLLLLASEHGEPLPARESLPPAAAFYDPDLRKFFASFVALYERGAGPRLREVLGEVRDLPGAEEKAAELLVESPDSPGAPPLGVALGNLGRRWYRHRLSELNQLISEAQRHGDSSRLEALLAEKSVVNAQLHGVGAGARS